FEAAQSHRWTGALAAVLLSLVSLEVPILWIASAGAWVWAIDSIGATRIGGVRVSFGNPKSAEVIREIAAERSRTEVRSQRLAIEHATKALALVESLLTRDTRVDDTEEKIACRIAAAMF